MVPRLIFWVAKVLLLKQSWPTLVPKFDTFWAKKMNSMSSTVVLQKVSVDQSWLGFARLLRSFISELHQKSSLLSSQAPLIFMIFHDIYGTDLSFPASPSPLYKARRVLQFFCIILKEKAVHCCDSFGQFFWGILLKNLNIKQTRRTTASPNQHRSWKNEMQFLVIS